MPKLLIIEDDPSMASALQEGFGFEGYQVSLARDGQAGLKMARETQPEVILLDVMLPKLSGLDVCRQLRQSGATVPILMLTARGQEIDKVMGLRLGADDYITKPFSFLELLARVEAVLRRSRRPGSKAAGDTLTRSAFGDITIDFKKCEVNKGRKPIELSAREFRLLKYFVEHQGEVIDRDTLLGAVWDHNEPPLTRTVDMHIAKLRKKIEDNPVEPRYLVTVHRMGYKLVIG